MPIVEEISAVIIQALEVVKAFLILKLSYIQDKKEETNKVNAIGFSVPSDEEEYDVDLS